MSRQSSFNIQSEVATEPGGGDDSRSVFTGDKPWTEIFSSRKHSEMLTIDNYLVLKQTWMRELGGLKGRIFMFHFFFLFDAELSIEERFGSFNINAGVWLELGI